MPDEKCEWCGNREGTLVQLNDGLTIACAVVGECRSREPDVDVCPYTDPREALRCHRPAGHLRRDPEHPDHYDAMRQIRWT